MRQNKRSTLFALSVLVVTLGSSCAVGPPSASVTSGGGPGPAEAQSVAYNGPKARITVATFTDKSAKRHGGIGGGMTDMISAALFNTNRFIVLESRELGAVLREQEPAAPPRIKKETEAAIGEVEGAELLVVGAITAFEPDTGGSAGGTTLIGVGNGGRAAHVAIDIRILDAKTSRTLAARIVEGEAQDSGGLAGTAVGPLPHGFAAFAKTPMEKAIRMCLRIAANFIVQQTPNSYYHY